MLSAKTRLLVGAVLLGICIFVASWAVTRQFAGETLERERVAAAIQKLANGRLLSGAQPPQRNNPEK